MAWLKVSDTAYDHPYLDRILELDYYTPGFKAHLFGFLIACADHSALYFTDYIIERGTARRIGGEEHWEKLVDAALKTGLFECTVRTHEGRIGYKLIDDPDNFVHIVLKREDEWNKGREKDLANTDLKGKVRMRDGDQCRWCGKVVNWSARKGGRRGTYDHAVPQQIADGDPEKLYVSCESCNKSRKDGQNWNKPLRAVPEFPYYSEVTVKQLGEWGFIVEPTQPPLYEEVDPAAVERAAVEPETSAPAPAAPVATAPSSEAKWTPVDPAEVEHTVEPETSAPAAPSATAPVESLPSIDLFELDLLRGELEAVKDLLAQYKASAVDSPSVESEISAPEGLSPVGEGSGRNLADLCRSSQEVTVGNLDFPGRDGSDRASSNTQSQESVERREVQGTSVSSGQKSRRKRRRRRSRNGGKRDGE